MASACQPAEDELLADDAIYGIATNGPGFYFWPPWGTTMSGTAPWEPAVYPHLVVRIDDIINGTAHELRSFSSTSNPRLLRGDNEQGFGVEWRSGNETLIDGHFYRITVLSDGTELGRSDIEPKWIPDIRRRPVLWIKFRVERPAVDVDGDTVLDWDDNCLLLSDPSNPMPRAETCDGVDNDCDGAIDNNNPGAGAACATQAYGACSAGLTTCQNGQLICSTSVVPANETCDGIDNDCDGTIDDGASATCPSTTNGVASCTAGSCAIASCTGAFGNCNNNAADGCETNLNTTNTSCGACGHACSAGQSCYGGACMATCNNSTPMPYPHGTGCTNVATRKTYSGSGSYGGTTPAGAGDDNRCTTWNSGGYPSQWWQVDLGATTALHGVTLVPNMSPTTANVTHIVETSANGSTWTTALTVSGSMTDFNTYSYRFTNVINARYLRVRTTSSPSWVAWANIGVFSCP